VHLNYRRQLNWPGAIIVQLFCERIGNTSLTIATQAWKRDRHGEAVVKVAEGIFVFVGMEP
jgi:acyl-CoA hydrolase